MDYGTLLIVLVIFGVISFVIERLWGFNPYQAYVAIGLITLFGSLIYIIAPVMSPPYNLELSIDRWTKWMVSFLPGAIIGDIAGVIIAKVTGQR